MSGTLPPPLPTRDYYVFYESTALWRATIRAATESAARALWEQGVNQGDYEVSENPAENIVDVRMKPDREQADV